MTDFLSNSIAELLGMLSWLKVPLVYFIKWKNNLSILKRMWKRFYISIYVLEIYHGSLILIITFVISLYLKKKYSPPPSSPVGSIGRPIKSSDAFLGALRGGGVGSGLSSDLLLILAGVTSWISSSSSSSPLERR